MTNTSLVKALAACGLLGWSGTAHATPNRTADYALHGDLAISNEAPFQRVSLPLGVYLAAREPGLADVRVFNGQGELVPFALVEPSARTETARHYVEARAFPLRSEAAASTGGLHIEVRRDNTGQVVAVDEPKAGEAAAMTRGYLVDTGTASGLRTRLEVTLSPSATGFHRIDIEASEDLVKWTPLVTEAVLAQFAYGKELLRQQNIELPGSSARYLRLNWREPARAAELTTVRVQLDDSHSVPPARIWSEPLPLTQAANGEYRLQLGGAVPADRLRLELIGKNVLIPVSISQRSSDAETWQALTQAVVYRLSAQGREWISPDIELWGEPVRQLRLQFDSHGGSPGDAAPLLRLGLRPRELVFVARGNGPFTLAIGQAGVPPDSLPIATLVPGFGSDGAPPIANAELRLGGARAVVPSAPPAAETFPRKWVLWAVLVAGALGLCAMALSLLRATRKKDDTPPEA
ncbi:MAG: DUF3999 domain-containing protein [Polyangiaceae bacterium]